ncbi:adenylate/guanylate cyclase domain-containing protein [Algoriphagus namhaensis]
MSQSLTKKLSVVFFSDIVGYTLLMGIDEERAYQLMKENLELHQRVFEKFDGVLIKELGDGILGTFDKAEDAVSASLEIQKEWDQRGEVELRIGLHCGEIIHERGDIFGDAVNIASRIQSIGVPSCVLFSKAILNLIEKPAHFEYKRLGKFKLRNVAKELELFAVTDSPLVVPERNAMIETIKSQERQPWKKFILIAVLALAIGAIVNSLFFDRSKPNWTKEKSIAVLPLKSLNADQTRQYFSDGLTEDIITQLSKIKALRVISRSTIALYKNSQESNPEIALALGVSTFLEGSVQWAGESLRITARLIDATTNEILWSETFDPELAEDLFELQTTIAKSIAESMQADVTLDEIQQLSEQPTANFQAYEEYLEGRGLYYDYQLEENLAAIGQFKRAIAIDSTFALAWAGLGDAYAQQYGLFDFREVWLDSSVTASEKAIALNPRLVEGYKALGSAYYYSSKYDLAEENLKRAIDLNPNHAQAVGNLATIYFINGALDKSLELQKKAVALNPKSHVPFQILGWNYRLLDQQEAAQEWLRKSIAIKPDYPSYEQLGLSFLATSQIDSVRLQITELKELAGSDPMVEQTMGILSFMIGDVENAENFLQVSISKKNAIEADPYFISPIYLAYLYQQSGQSAKADPLLEDRSSLYAGLLQEADFDKDFALFMAKVAMIQGDASGAQEYLNMAEKQGFLDVIMVDKNPLFDPLKGTTSYRDWKGRIDSRIEDMAKNSMP